MELRSRLLLTVCRKCGSKLGQIERSQDSGYIGIMREVKIQRLVRRESPLVVVKRQVGLSASSSEHVVLQARKDLLDVANTDGFPCRRLEIVVTREGEINRILEAFPFLVGEQITDGRVPKRYRLVRT